jgi:TatD DNase family protein
MRYIDLHSHLDFPEIAERLGTVIKNAREAGLSVIVSSGIDPKSNREALRISGAHPIVRPSLGLYPIDALQREQATHRIIDVDAELSFIRDNADSLVAIGEIGLDYKMGNDKEAQKALFRKLLALAVELEKPVIIHSRNAEADALDILKEFESLKVVMHCFSGRRNLVETARDRGYFFTVPTHVVRLVQFQDLVSNVDLKQLFCETDSPFLSPYKDKRNEPAFVVESYRKIAEIKGMEVEEVGNIIFNNFQRVFL